jgi:hypothetical protein
MKAVRALPRNTPLFLETVLSSPGIVLSSNGKYFPILVIKGRYIALTEYLASERSIMVQISEPRHHVS